MLDAYYLLVAVVFFAVCWGFVRACEKL